ncbi:hypothetical protein VYG11_002686 [Salmonella enterica]|nr:hypothetical protein [Salmonella enterica]
MIPFARILSYGNIAPNEPKLYFKKIQGFSTGLMALTDDGQLYSTGRDNYGHIGGVGDSVDKWVLLNGDCEYFWTSSYGTIFKTKSNDWFFSGTLRALGTSDSLQKTFINISSLMGIVQYNDSEPEKTNIQISYDGLFYHNKSVSSILYGLGKNQFYTLGNGNNSPVTSFQQIHTTTNDYMVLNNSATLLVNTTDNAYVGTGSVQPFNASSSTYTTFTNVQSPNTYKHRFFISSYLSYIVIKDNHMWASGVGGKLGTGVSGDASGPTTIANYEVMAPKQLPYKTVISCSPYVTILLLNDGLYGTGSNTIGQLTSAIPEGTALTFQKMKLPDNVLAKDILFYGANNNTTYVCTKNDIYYCGYIAQSAGFIGHANTNQWVKSPVISKLLGE